MAKKEVTVKKKRVRKLDTSFDRFAPMRNYDRSTRAGFKKYMEANPAYFSHVFPGTSIGEAWKKLTIN